MPKVPFANKMMTAIALYLIRIPDRANSRVKIDNKVDSYLRKYIVRVSDESLGRDETSFVRLTTNNVFSHLKCNHGIWSHEQSYRKELRERQIESWYENPTHFAS